MADTSLNGCHLSLRARHRLLCEAERRVEAALKRTTTHSRAIHSASEANGPPGPMASEARLLAEAHSVASAAEPGLIGKPHPRHACNTANRPQLFHATAPVLGVGMKHRRDRFTRANSLDPTEDAALRHYGTQQVRAVV